MNKIIRYVKGVDGKISSSTDAVRLFQPSFVGLDHEEVWILLLDNANNPILKSLSTIGGLFSTVFDIRRIVKEVLIYDAAKVIICHNHMGDVDPSKDDIRLTENLRNALKLFDISLVDHIILNGIEYYSMADEAKHKL